MDRAGGIGDLPPHGAARRGTLRAVRGWCVAGAATLLGLLCIALPVAGGGGYPARREPLLNDFTHRLSAAERGEIEVVLARAREATGIEAVVVVVGSRRDYPTGDASLEEFATHLFNDWGIGSASRHDGVMVLVALDDREVRIELGAGWGADRDAAMGRILDGVMAPRFRRGEIGAGIAAGAREALAALAAGPPPRVGESPIDDRAGTRAEAPPPAATGDRSPSRALSRRQGKGVGLVLALLAVLAGGLGFGAYRTFRPPRCSRCKIPMRRLPEDADDVYLDSGQRLEELLRSVDYGVWRCPGCNLHQIQRRKLASAYGECPSCAYRTLQAQTRTRVAPSEEWTGLEVIDRKCRHCGFEDEQRIVLPRLTPSRGDLWDFSGSLDRRDRPLGRQSAWSGRSSSRGSSSGRSGGGSSSGGGRSSGHGASGRW